MDRSKDDHATDSTGAATISHREKSVDRQDGDGGGGHQHKLRDVDMQGVGISVQKISRRLHQPGDDDAKHHHSHQLQYGRCVSVDGTSSGPSASEKMRYHGRKSDSPPIRSPSYVQHRQFRPSLHRSTDIDVLHPTIETIDNNKENTVPIVASVSPDARLDSPKFALGQQNSPNTPLSCYKSPPSTHSSPMYTAHETHTDCNVFTYSPLISEPFKHSTYFHFPDVDQVSTPTSVVTNTAAKDDNSNLLNEMNTLQIDDEPSPKVGRKTKKEAIRRARLKSISLDSDGARLVEENLCIPVEELLVERTLPHSGAFNSEQEQCFDGSYEALDEPTAAATLSPFKASSTKNNQLVLDLTLHDETLSRSLNRVDDGGSNEATSSKLHTPKTPTLTQSRQKAISLDSAPKSAMRDKRSYLSSASSDNCHQPMLRTKPFHHYLQVETNASMSMPTTPKRQHLVKSGKAAVSGGTTVKSAKKLMCGVNFNLIGSSHSGGSASLGLGKKSNAPIDRKTINDTDASLPANASNIYSISLPMQSNVNLKTLPEKTIICDFTSETNDRASIESNFEDYYDEAYMGESDDVSCTAADDIECDIIGGSVSSLISGSNLSSNNNGIGNGNGNGNGNGSGGSSSRNQNVLSLSNYSLSNFQGSHCSLARSNYNLYGISSGGISTIAPSAPNKSTFVSVPVGGALTTGRLHAAQTNQSTATTAFPMSTSRSSINCCSKKNLLQRRGSNTSLTLNIVGGSGGNSSIGMGGMAHSTLNRFNSNSHSSLNVMSTPFDIQRNNLSNAKKGLLERRNSNASLTLNIQKRALSTSNCYLRGSDLSLSSSMNNYEQHSEEHQACSMCGGGGILKKQFDRKPAAKRIVAASTSGQTVKLDRSHNAPRSSHIDDDNTIGESSDQTETDDRTAKPPHTDVLVEHQEDNSSDNTIRTKTPRSAHRRKFLSSENLNIHQPFSLCQLPIKTSSVFDLNQITSKMMHNAADKMDDDGDDSDDDNELTYCPCSNNIIRNITTKPLSPQTTSEDFKIYLANIQILQNASNTLSHHELNVLGHVFNRSYTDTSAPSASEPSSNDGNGAAANASASLNTITSQLPSEREQNCLLTNLHQEFWDLPTNYQEKPLIFGSHAKNRYKTILPNEHSRVILVSEFDDDDAKEAKGRHPQEQSTFELYINANYIKGPDYTQNAYIATQGPMSNTIYDFWLMVFQNMRKSFANCAGSGLEDSAGAGGVDMVGQQKIVMLTDIIENDESKCAIYFPQAFGKVSCFLNQFGRRQKDCQIILDRLEAHFNRTDVWPSNIPTAKVCDLDRSQVPEGIDYSYFCVKNVGVSNRKGYTMRKFHCIYHLNKQPSHLLLATKSNDCGVASAHNRGSRDDSCDRKAYQFVAYHYWFPHWPDHRSPENIDVVLDMCIDLLDSDCDLFFKTGSQGDGDTDHTMDKSTLATDVQAIIPTGPIPIIHCSAGIGRTGCVAAILNGIRQMRTSWTTAANKSGMANHVSVDVLGIVSNLRLQRGGMVQNSEQYELIHRALCLYYQRLFTN